jgi:hypothetical protein
MIFFAVFMGFIAENIRESISEHHRVKAYAATMISDLLQADNDSLKSYVKYYTYATQNIDSLMDMLSKHDIKSIPTGKLYYHGLFGGAYRTFVPNDATFQQLKSTGSLQFFEKHIAREIEQYDLFCRQMLIMQENDRPVFVEVRKLRAQIFQFQYNSQANNIVQYSFLHGLDTAAFNKFIKSNPPLLTYDKAVFNQYVEMVRSRFMDRNLQFAIHVFHCNTQLLNDLEKEYGDGE